jgi:hypothetical protein
MPNKSPIFELSQLKSRPLAAAILRNLGGGDIKLVSFGSLASSGDGGGGGGILGFLGGLLSNAKGLLSFASGLIGRVFRFSLTSLVSLFQSNVYTIFNFNWAATDKEIDAQIQGQFTAIAALLGGTLGNAAGWVVAGGSTNALIACINPAMGAYVLRYLGEEALDEFTGNLVALINVTVQSFFRTIFYTMYKNNRALFSLYRDGVGSLIDLVVPGNLSWQQYVKQRTKTGGIISFADFFEESVESIKNPITRVFVEEFFEEFGEGAFESLYVAAGGIESFTVQQRLQKDTVLGGDRIVEITPDRTAPEEKLLIAGKEEVAKGAIVHALANTQLIRNRDVGQIAGVPMEEYVKPRQLSLSLELILFPYREPPFERDRSIRPRQVQVRIPDLDRSKVDYETIRLACGGANGYTWGRYCAIAHLDTGRKIQVYGASEAEAEQHIERLLLLTEAKMLSLNINEMQNKGEVLSNPVLRKEPRQVYPGYATIINRDLFLAKNKGKPSLKGNYHDRDYRLEIWRPQQPDDFNAIVAEALRKAP